MKSIRRHLVLSLLIGFGLLWLAGAAIVYVIARGVLQADFDATLVARLEAIASMTEQSPDKVELDDAEQFDRAQAKVLSPTYFQMWLADGLPLMRSSALGTNDLRRFAVSVGNARLFCNLTLPGGSRGRAVAFRFTPQWEPDAPAPPASAVPKQVDLIVAASCGNLDRTLRALLATLLGVAALALVVTVVLVTRSVRAGVAPVAAIADRAAAIDAQSLDQRFDSISMPAELRPISDRLNDLMARLQAGFERERRFSADVAHELRTPIAELRSLAEVALKWPDDAAATAQAVEDARQIALQMEAIVTRLLAMVRCEAGNQPLQREPVAISELVAEVLRPLEPQADTKQLAVTVAVPDGTRIVTDRALFQSILANLLANAVEYTPPRGRLDLRFTGDGGRFTLTVANTVTGLTADDLSHFFERFWRKDAARSGTEHCGLGLALSQTFARTLSLRLTAALTASDTLALTIEGGNGGEG